MAYYNDKVEHENGRLVLFMRDLTINAPNAKTRRTPKWYMKITIEGHKGRAITKSTKQSSYEDAYIVARQEYDRLTTAARLGHTLDAWTFEKHWNDWYNRQVNAGAWSDSRADWHLKYFKRYFSEYFYDKKTDSSMLLDDVNVDYAQRYFEWRIGYWDTHSKLKKYNPKRRDAKTRATNNAVKVPAQKTLQMEQAALNQIFFDAVERGRTQQRFRLKAPAVDNGDAQRAGFDEQEYNVLTRNLRSYRDAQGRFKAIKLNSVQAMARQQMYYFVLFLANSGLRVGEARMMKWSDIAFDIATGNEQHIAEVRVSQHTKKRKVRYVQTQANGNQHLKRWREITPYNDDNDWVWFSVGKDNAVRQFTDLNKTFQTILKSIPYKNRTDGLLNDADGKRRSLYSLRHVYATLRLAQGVSIYDLADNMGTQVKQIEIHYSHLTTRDKREDITKVNAKQAVVQKTDTTENAIERALRLFDEGRITEATLNNILAQTNS